MTTAPTIRSLKTTDAASGMTLAMDLARELSSRTTLGQQVTSKPGGTNYGEPAPIPLALIASILFTAVSIANDGWKS